jgi:hypothetical protein
MRKPPIRIMIYLAVLGVTGSILFAAESNDAKKATPASAATQSANDSKAAAKPGDAAKAGDATPTDAKPADAKASDAKAEADAKTVGETKDASAEGKPASTVTPATATTATPPLKGDDEEKLPPLATGSTDTKGPSPQRFVPSEQVRADFDVSFPIDI